MRRIAVINQKGGVGKTTTVANLGAALALQGRRVLLVDLDPQAHLTLNLGIEPDTNDSSTYEVLTQSVPLSDATVAVRDGLWLVPAHTDLVAAESQLLGVVAREVILRDALRSLDSEYDLLLIDCPPSLGILTLNALAAAEEIIIPLQPHFLALQGVARLLETVSLVQTRINPHLHVEGVVLCLHESGTRLAAEVVDDVRQFLTAAHGRDVPWSQGRLYQSFIRRNIKLAECPSRGQTIFDYAPRSNGAHDYAALAAELLARAAPASGTGQEQTPVGAEAAAPATQQLLPAPLDEPAPMCSETAAPPQTPDAVRVESTTPAEPPAEVPLEPATPAGSAEQDEPAPLTDCPVQTSPEHESITNLG